MPESQKAANKLYLFSGNLISKTYKMYSKSELIFYLAIYIIFIDKYAVILFETEV